MTGLERGEGVGPVRGFPTVTALLLAITLVVNHSHCFKASEI